MKGPFHEDEDAMMRPKKAKKKTPERAFKNEAALSTAIIDKLNKQNGVKCQKIKGTAYGKPTLDILGSKNGRFFWLETKQPGEKPTKRQYNTMKDWISAGAVASWTDSVEGSMKFFLADWSTLTEKQMMEGFHEL
jgi:hypothetical protein